MIIDTDILSIFAKINAVDLLKQLLGETAVAITPKIMDEISVPLEYGYSFPLKVFSTVKPVPLSEDCSQENRP